MSWKRMLWVGIAMIALGASSSGPAGTGANSAVVEYTLVIDPDAADRVQINLPAGAEYIEDAPLRHDTRNPSVFVFQDYIMEPGANSGWHTHDGIVLTTVVDGTVEWYDKTCTEHVHSAGEFFTESDQLHFVRNASAGTARLIQTFIIAKGEAKKNYRPAPPCAAALGIDVGRFPGLPENKQSVRAASE